jgi:glycosyltransferase involved in cell wall biosynthesis
MKILTSQYGVHAPSHEDGDVIRSLYLQAGLDYYRPADFFLKRASQERFNQDVLRAVLGEFAPEVAVVWGMYLLSHNLPYWLEQWMPGRVVYYLASYWPTDDDPHRAYWRLRANKTLTEQVKRPLRAFALSQLRREKYPPALRFVNALCCSRHVRDQLASAGMIPPNSDVLHIGIDPLPFQNRTAMASRSEDAPLRLLYFGRLIEDKGVHTAIQALGILNQRGLAAHVELTILGNGHPDYEARLHSVVSDFGLGDQVRFAGKIRRDEIPAVLCRYDVFLFTSIWPEPFGRTIVEAMLAGLIVIGSDVGGSREILAHYDADLLYPAGDAYSLASRIALLLDGSKDKQQLARRGRALALERFSLQTMLTGFEKYLVQSVGMKADPSKIATAA